MSEAPVAEAAPQEGADEGSAPADRGKSTSTSPAPASPSTVKERQIPVDPASLRRLGMVADGDSPVSAPSVLTEVVVQSPILPPLRRPTFVGASLPCSAASSPVHGGARPGAGGAKWEEQPTATTHSPTSVLRSLARQHSAALARLVAAPAPSTLSRSAPRAEGRSTMATHDDEEREPVQQHKTFAEEDGGFTCGALCMLFPGFSKRKPATATAAAFAGTTTAAVSSSMQRQQSGFRPRRSSASRVASLERFECGSWSPPPPLPPPPPPVDDAVDCHATEVAKISCADGDAEAPVKMAFVFDGEAPAATRGILKNSASSRLIVDSARPSTSSQRHVRFSTAVVAADAASSSCPSSPCITPRLAIARAEFHAFLEAQSA
ncbi:hypothetical protein BDA96_10G229400 [Sorghum bicolor]|uniref:Uncharacterized protein n=1 Tax=Sorghum bicolor TaxID=4558 RepID=A0A921U1K5_SORBI|nr:hypothetical protein BDA96_10G229400 [Sorghum bicolor]